MQVHSSPQDTLAQAIEQEFLGQGKLTASDISHYALSSLPEPEDTITAKNTAYLVLEEVQTAILTDMHPEQFTGLKRLVTSASSILWVTGGDLLSGRSPSLALAHGLNTVLMNEHSARNLRFAALDLDYTNASHASHVPAVAQTLTAASVAVAAATTRADCETDFMLKDGVLHICRVAPDMALNSEFTLDTGSDGRADQDFPTEGNVQLAMGTPGLLDTVYFRERPTCDMALGDEEVEIRVQAVGLNMKVRTSLHTVLRRWITNCIGLRDCNGQLRERQVQQREHRVCVAGWTQRLASAARRQGHLSGARPLRYIPAQPGAEVPEAGGRRGPRCDGHCRHRAWHGHLCPGLPGAAGSRRERAHPGSYGWSGSGGYPVCKAYRRRDLRDSWDPAEERLLDIRMWHPGGAHLLVALAAVQGCAAEADQGPGSGCCSLDNFRAWVP